MNTKYKISEKFIIPVMGKKRSFHPTEEVDENKLALVESTTDEVKDPENLDMFEIKVLDIFHAVNAIHHQATAKYSPYSWEEEFSDALDSSPICNLQAMLRHTMRMFKDQEWIEKESGMPHIHHLYCRAQMYITSFTRINEGSVDAKNPDKNIINKYDSYINETTFTLAPKQEPNAYVTPEFIFHIANITNKDIANVASQYNILTNKNSVLRRFIIRLYEYIEFYQGTMSSAPPYKIDIEVFIKELLIEIIVVCGALQYWQNDA